MTSKKAVNVSRVLGQAATGAAFAVFFGLAGVTAANARELGVTPQKGAPVPPGGGGSGCYDDGNACKRQPGKQDTAGKSGRVEFKQEAGVRKAEQSSRPAARKPQSSTKTNKPVRKRDDKNDEPRRSSRDDDSSKNKDDDDHEKDRDKDRSKDRDDDSKNRDRDDEGDDGRKNRDHDDDREDDRGNDHKEDNDKPGTHKDEPDKDKDKGKDKAREKRSQQKQEPAKSVSARRPSESTPARRTTKARDTPVSLTDDGRDLGDIVGDAAASLANSYAHNPEAAAALGVGGGMISAGGVAMLAGGGISATGPGVVVGAPMAVGGAGMVLGGAGLATLGGLQIVTDALGQYRVVTPEEPTAIPAPLPFVNPAPVAPELPGTIAPAPPTAAPPAAPGPNPPGRPIPPVLPGLPDTEPPDRTTEPRTPASPERPADPERPGTPGTPEQPGDPDRRSADPDAPTTEPNDRPRPLDAPKTPEQPERPRPPERPERVSEDAPLAPVSPLSPSDAPERNDRRDAPGWAMDTGSPDTSGAQDKPSTGTDAPTPGETPQTGRTKPAKPDTPAPGRPSGNATVSAASMGEVGTELAGALTDTGQGRRALAHAGEALYDAHQYLATVLEGSYDPEVQNLLELVTYARAKLEETQQLPLLAENGIRSYLGTLGVSGTAGTTDAKPTSRPESTPSTTTGGNPGRSTEKPSGFRAPNPAHPPDQNVVDAMKCTSTNTPGFDCSEIAEDLFEAAGGKGRIVSFTQEGDMLTVPEGAGTAEYTYHHVYTDGRYVYDPRLRPAPVPWGDYMRTMKALNPGLRWGKPGFKGDFS